MLKYFVSLKPSILSVLSFAQPQPSNVPAMQQVAQPVSPQQVPEEAPELYNNNAVPAYAVQAAATLMELDCTYPHPTTPTTK